MNDRSELARVVEAIQQLSLARDEARVLEIVRRAARELTGADGATFVLREGDTCYYAGEDAIAPLWKGRRFPADQCVSGWAMRNGEPVVIEDVRADPRILAEAYEPTFVRSLVTVPIRPENPMGAIGNYWAREHRPTEREIYLLQALANSTAVALENVRLYCELERRVSERTAELERQVCERKRAEDMLRESNQRLAAIIDSAMDAIISIDAEQRIVLFNRAAEAMFHCSAGDAIGKPIDTLIPEAFRSAHSLIVRGFLDGGASSFRVAGVRALRGLRSDGEEFPIEASVSKLNLTNGVLATVIVRDISERVKAESARAESEARFRYVTEAAEVGYWDWDVPGGRLEWSSSCRALFAIPASESLSYERFLAAVHDEDRTRIDAMVRTALGGGGGYDVEIRTNSDGSERWVRAKGRVTFGPDGLPMRMGGIALEVTERRRAEQALREKEELLRMFAEGAPAGIAMFDREMRFLAVSRRFLHDFHMTGTDVLGRNLYEVFPEIGPLWREVHCRCLAGETMRIDEDVFLRADGRVQWVRWEITPWYTASGAVGGIILFNEEITARKRVEDELRAAKAEADRANEAKSRFLAAASHDLRQPLSALSLYAKVLEGHVDCAGAPLLAKLKACLASLGELLSDLLDLSKLQAGVVKAEVADFPVADVLANLVSVHEPEARLKGLRLRCLPTPLWGRTDVVLFQRIVGNVIDNAVRYTDRGGVLVACRKRGGKAWVEVWDSGAGIPPDKTAEIFEEFRQLGDGARTRGSGLGLAIVAKTAALLGLEVSVRSRVGRGSVFAIELPLGQASPAVLSEADIVPCRALRVALVEDNVVVREALATALQSLGHQVVSADTGRAICAALGRRAPDIVISDYRLADGETGFHVVTAVRAAVDRKVPAILVTGDTDPDLVRNMAARGVAVLHKPLDLETLQAYMDDLSSEDAILPQ